MEVLGLIYYQFIFTAGSMECQLTATMFFQPLALQPLVPVATAIHYALPAYASGQQAMVIISQDEYQGTFCPSHGIYVILETTALINYAVESNFSPSPLQHNSWSKNVYQSWLTPLSQDWHSSISFRTLHLPILYSQAAKGASQSTPVLLSLDWPSWTAYHPTYPTFQPALTGIGTPYSALVLLFLD